VSEKEFTRRTYLKHCGTSEGGGDLKNVANKEKMYNWTEVRTQLHSRANEVWRGATGRGESKPMEWGDHTTFSVRVGIGGKIMMGRDRARRSKILEESAEVQSKNKGRRGKDGKKGSPRIREDQDKRSDMQGNFYLFNG